MSWCTAHSHCRVFTFPLLCLGAPPIPTVGYTHSHYCVLVHRPFPLSGIHIPITVSWCTAHYHCRVFTFPLLCLGAPPIPTVGSSHSHYCVLVHCPFPLSGLHIPITVSWCTAHSHCWVFTFPLLCLGAPPIPTVGYSHSHYCVLVHRLFPLSGIHIPITVSWCTAHSHCRVFTFPLLCLDAPPIPTVGSYIPITVSWCTAHSHCRVFTFPLLCLGAPPIPTVGYSHSHYCVLMHRPFPLSGLTFPLLCLGAPPIPTVGYSHSHYCVLVHRPFPLSGIHIPITVSWCTAHSHCRVFTFPLLCVGAPPIPTVGYSHSHYCVLVHRPFPLSGLTFPLLCLGAPPIPTVGYTHSHYCVLVHRPFPLSGIHIPITVCWCTAYSHCRVYTFPLLCLGALPIPTVGYSHSHYCVLVHRLFPLSGIHIPITVSWCTAHSHCRVFTFPLLCLDAPPIPTVGSYIPITVSWCTAHSHCRVFTFPLLCLGAPPIPTVGSSHSHYCVLMHRPFPLSGIHIPITVSWCTAHSHCRVFTFPLLCLDAPPIPTVGYSHSHYCVLVHRPFPLSGLHIPITVS